MVKEMNKIEELEERIKKLEDIIYGNGQSLTPYVPTQPTEPWYPTHPIYPSPTYPNFPNVTWCCMGINY
jgi:hypothetical protein